MPTYDYECKECGHAFELFQQMTASVKKKCPECGKLALKRLIGTGAGVLFKGGGFYETDYRSESYKKAADADKPQSAKSAKSAKSEKSDTSTKAAAAPKKDAPVKKPASGGGSTGTSASSD